MNPKTLLCRCAAPVVALTLLGLASACIRDPETAKRRFFASGEAYSNNKDYPAAIIQYRNAVQQDQRFGEARYKLALAYGQTGDRLNALREGVRAADLLPDRADVQLHAANLLILARQFADARARAEAVLQKEPRNVQAQVALGNALAGMKDLPGAVKEIEEALRLDPQRSATYTNLGALQAARGDVSAAEKAFKSAVEHDPKSVPVRLSLAQFYWLAGRADEAERTMSEALAIPPGDALANRMMALFYQVTDRAAQAEPFLKKAVEVDPTSPNRLALADYYVDMGRGADATPLLQTLSNDPEYGVWARIRLAEMDLRAGRPDVAERAIDNILRTAPRDEQALLAKASLLLTRKQYDDALVLANDVIAADPTSASARFMRGRIMAATQKPDEAKSAFNETLRLNPRAAVAQVELARLHLQAGAVESSVALASEAVKNDPKNNDARLVLARGLMARGELDQASKLIDQLLTAAPKSAVLYAQKGRLRVARNDRPGAEAEFQRALAIDPLQLEAIAGLVASDLSEGNAAGAIRRVDAVVGSAPQNAGVLTLAARTHVITGDTKGAEPLLIKAIALDPSRLAAYAMLGQIYVMQQRLDDARHQFEKLADRQSRPVPALTMVGMIHQMSGHVDEARSTFERVLELDPRAAVAANNLAWIYCETGGNLDAALQLAQTAKARLPEQPEIDDTLGWIYYKKDFVPLAISALKLSAERDPRNAVTQFHLGLAYVKGGDKIRARRALEAALRLQPDFPGATEAMRVLASL